MLRRFKTAILDRQAASSSRDSAGSLRSRIARVIEEKGRCVVAVAGSPGSGKSLYAGRIRADKASFYPDQSVTAINDLKTWNGLRLARGASGLAVKRPEPVHFPRRIEGRFISAPCGCVRAVCGSGEVETGYL